MATVSSTATSAVTEQAAAAPADAQAHFVAKLAFEVDPADVAYAQRDGADDFVLVDARIKGHYTKAHLPGALNLPVADITAEALADIPTDKLIITYCWGPACNGSTKAAAKIAALGRQVKEMIGGFEYWVREGWPTEGKRPVDPATAKPTDLGLFC